MAALSPSLANLSSTVLEGNLDNLSGRSLKDKRLDGDDVGRIETGYVWITPGKTERKGGRLHRQGGQGQG